MKPKFTIVCIILNLTLGAQNLVPNGSFEHFAKCPINYSTNYYTAYVNIWDSPNSGTPDYFNACSDKCGIPVNWVGNSEAFDGSAYMGIIGCMQQIDRNQISYREYLRVNLSDTLEQGKIYYASMQVRLGLSCSIACGGIGMYVTSETMRSNQSYNYPVKAQINYFENKIIDEKDRWTKICGTFIANGGETFLIIGNFLSNQQMKYKVFDENFIPTQTINPSAYYYIDDVQLLVYSDTCKYACENLSIKIPDAFEGSLDVNTTLILKNLYFDMDKAVILKESFFELDELASELKRKPNLKIAIYGHTDNTGSIDHNQSLSEQRARAVKNYLIEKGISVFRITFKGYGSSKPISDNHSENGRQLNRRVEIEVL